jgi:pimeloyl-ACP methyl ester carboxylesterase
MKTFFAIICGLLALVIVAVGIWAWTPDRSRSDLNAKYLGAATRFLKVAGTELRVRDTGPRAPDAGAPALDAGPPAPGAPAIILLHGFASSLETWEPWARALSARYRVVRFDLPGSGLSPPDPSGNYTDARSLEILRALMDQLGIAKAVLVGNSMGGRIAWRFAAAYPSRVDKLVLISPDGFASPGFEYGKAPQVPAVIQLMKYFLPRALLQSNLAAAYADPARLGDAQVTRYYELLLAPGNRAAMIARMRQTLLEDPLPLLKSIEVPTLILWGEQDRLIPYANSADYLRALPNATRVSFPDLGHVPHEEAPAESLVPLEEFLAR